MKKIRLDLALAERGLVESREKAQRLIMAGHVRINDVPAAKASVQVLPEDRLEVMASEKYVSRGGMKLEAALDHFGLDCRGRVALDVGASTGGFSDCLLQRGVVKLYAVDVGENQLAWKVRSDSRVTVLDKTNARFLRVEQFSEKPNLVTADVSFISLTKVLSVISACVSLDTDGVLLIKPQFEAGREQVGKGGVVRDPAVHKEVVERICGFVEKELKAKWLGVVESPVLGPAGNKEFLARIKLNPV